MLKKRTDLERKRDEKEEKVEKRPRVQTQPSDTDTSATSSAKTGLSHPLSPFEELQLHISTMTSLHSKKRTSSLHTLSALLINVLNQDKAEEDIAKEMVLFFENYFRTQASSNHARDFKTCLIPTTSLSKSIMAMEIALINGQFQIAALILDRCTRYTEYKKKKIQPARVVQLAFLKILEQRAILHKFSIEALERCFRHYPKELTELNSQLVHFLMKSFEVKVSQDHFPLFQLLLSRFTEENPVANLNLLVSFLIGKLFSHSPQPTQCIEYNPTCRDEPTTDTMIFLKTLFAHPLFKANTHTIIEDDLLNRLPKITSPREETSSLSNFIFYMLEPTSYCSDATFTLLKEEKLAFLPLEEKHILTSITDSNMRPIENRLRIYFSHGKISETEELIQTIEKHDPVYRQKLCAEAKNNLFCYFVQTIPMDIDHLFRYLSMMHYFCIKFPIHTNREILIAFFDWVINIHAKLIPLIQSAKMSPVPDLETTLPPEEKMAEILSLFNFYLSFFQKKVGTSESNQILIESCLKYDAFEFFKKYFALCTLLQLQQITSFLLTLRKTTPTATIFLNSLINEHLLSLCAPCSVVVLESKDEKLTLPSLSATDLTHDILDYLIEIKSSTHLKTLLSANLIHHPEQLLWKSLTTLIKNMTEEEKKEHLIITNLLLPLVSLDKLTKLTLPNNQQVNYFELLIQHERNLPHFIRTFLEAHPKSRIIFSSMPRAQDGQTTHRVGVHESSSVAAKKLFERYLAPLKLDNEKLPADKRERAWDEKLNHYLSEMHSYLNLKLTSEIIAIPEKDRWATAFSTLLFPDTPPPPASLATPLYLSPFTVVMRVLPYLTRHEVFKNFLDPQSQVSLKSALVSVWLATQDRTIFITDEDQDDAKIGFIRCLAEASRDYKDEQKVISKDSLVCPAGFFNKAMEALDKKHPSVKLVSIPLFQAIEIIHSFFDNLIKGLSPVEKAQLLIEIKNHPYNELPDRFMDEHKKAFFEYALEHYGASETIMERLNQNFHERNLSLYTLHLFPSLVAFAEEQNRDKSSSSASESGIFASPSPRGEGASSTPTTTPSYSKSH